MSRGLRSEVFKIKLETNYEWVINLVSHYLKSEQNIGTA